MSYRIAIKDQAREALMFKSRLVAALVFVVVCTLIILGRMVKLQALDYEHFRTLSHNNRVKVVPVAPTRGLIFDRNGVVLAQNTPSFALEVVPEAVEDMEATLEALGELVEVRERDLERFRRLLKKKRRFQSLPLRTRLSEEDVARFAVNRHRFPGVDIEARLTREYPQGPLGVHVVGYVGRISEQELKQVDAGNYRGTDHIGKTGVEQAYESALHGRVGFQHVETNAQGRVLRVLSFTSPSPGSSLHLSIDASLQAAAERALGDRRGAVVAIEPASGAVLALASTPGFDPNLFVDGIDSATYQGLVRSADRPLFNRALHGRYPPGSTVKPFFALAGLQDDLDMVHGEINCHGFYRLKGRQHKYRDWKKYGHGKVDLTRSIVESCDVFYYELALALGIDRMHAFMGRFGFGRLTGIDLPGEAPGLMPSRQWKRGARGQPWYPGETLITGIGQGFMLSTPLQLASATATLAMRGQQLLPHVVTRVEQPVAGSRTPSVPRVTGTLDLDDPHFWDRIISAMTDVVHGKRGTARRVGKGAAYRMAGKTGTAQVFGVGQEEEYNADEVDERLRDHGLFVAFAPVDAPRIAIAIVVENGGSGSGAAAPVARALFDQYLIERPGGPGSKGLMLTGGVGPEPAAEGAGGG